MILDILITCKVRVILCKNYFQNSIYMPSLLLDIFIKNRKFPVRSESFIARIQKISQNTTAYDTTFQRDVGTFQCLMRMTIQQQEGMSFIATMKRSTHGLKFNMLSLTQQLQLLLLTYICLVIFFLGIIENIVTMAKIV